jgi:hypothetical protein
MQVTGYMLQNRLRELSHLHGLASKQFDDGKYLFSDEEAPSAAVAFELFQKVEDKICRLQTLQLYYNLACMVEVQGSEMTLAEAVKRVGGAGRMEKMWRSAAVPKRDRYSSEKAISRSREEEYAKPTVNVGEALYNATAAGRWASSLREAIQVGNSTQWTVPDHLLPLAEPLKAD